MDADNIDIRLAVVETHISNLREGHGEMKRAIEEVRTDVGHMRTDIMDRIGKLDHKVAYYIGGATGILIAIELVIRIMK